MPASKFGVKNPQNNTHTQICRASFKTSDSKIALTVPCAVYNATLVTLLHSTYQNNLGSESMMFISPNMDARKIFSKKEEERLLQYIKQVVE